MKNAKNEDCSFICEQSFCDLLLALEKRFKKHLALFKFNLYVQINIIDSMWAISQRFLILTRGAVCIRPYPQEQSDREERDIRTKFEIKKSKLWKSNYKLAISLDDLEKKCRLFDRSLTSTIDLSLPSETIEGNNVRQPIHFYIEFYGDFLKFFQDIQNQLRLMEKNLSVEGIKSILEYKNHLQPNKTELDYFEKSMFKS